MTRRGSLVALLLLTLTSVDAGAQTATHDLPVLDRFIAVSLDRVPLRDALDSVARLARLRISYSPDLLPAGHAVTLVEQRITAGAALRGLLGGTGLDVTVSASGLVVIGPRVPPRALHGRIVDAVTRAPVAGVAVELEDGTATMLTGSDGSFAVAVPEGPARRLLLRRIGYQTTTVLVSAAMPSASLDVALAPAALTLDRLDVVGPRATATESQPPHAMTVLRPAEIAAVQPRTLAEVFGAAAAMLAPADGTPTPRLRVTGLRGATSLALSPPKIYVDGVELAQPQYAGIIDPALIERIEIVRGPQGAALYGSDAIGGVVHIITRKGAPGSGTALGGEARSATGWLQPALGGASSWTADQFGAATYGSRHSAATVAASFTRLGDMETGGGRRMGGFGGVRGTGTRVAAEASFHIAEQTWQPTVNDVLRMYDYPILQPALDEPQRARQVTAGTTLRVLAHPIWSHTITAGHDHNVLDVTPERAPQISPPDSTLGSARGTSSRSSVRYTSLLRVPAGERNALLVTVGGEIARLRYEALTIPRDSPSRVTRHRITGTRRDAGAFSQLELSLSRLLLSAGMRAEHSSTFGDEHGAAWLPTAGAAWRMTLGPVGARVRGAWGRAIRPASPMQLDATPRLHVLTDPALAPEQQTGAELGIDVDLAGRALLRVTRFDQTVDGLIYNVKVDSTTAVRQNVGRIENRGWESELAVHIGAFTARGSHTSVDSRVARLLRAYAGELQAGDRVPEVPAQATALTLAWERAGTSVALTGLRVGSWESYDWLHLFEDRAIGTINNAREYRITYDPLIRFDFAASHRVAGRVAAIVKVGNLTDSRRSGRDNLEHVPGRSVSLGIEIR